MPFRDILLAFEDTEDFPVDLKKISDWIIQRGVQDEIEFIGVDLDIGVLRGFLHRFRYSPGVYKDPVCAAHIYYGQEQSEDWKNIVCCKELVHLMDATNGVKRKEDFDTLARRLALPRELEVILEDPGFARVDKFGDLYAAALLIPYAARALLKPRYDDGDLTVWDIARLAVIPTKYVRMVMSDDWEQVYEMMLKT